jgi:hypothetical protein
MCQHRLITRRCFGDNFPRFGSECPRPALQSGMRERFVALKTTARGRGRCLLESRCRTLLTYRLTLVHSDQYRELFRRCRCCTRVRRPLHADTRGRSFIGNGSRQQRFPGLTICSQVQSMDDIDIIRLQRSYATFSLWRLKNQKRQCSGFGSGKKNLCRTVERRSLIAFRDGGKVVEDSFPPAISRVVADSDRSASIPVFPIDMTERMAPCGRAG